MKHHHRDELVVITVSCRTTRPRRAFFTPPHFSYYRTKHPVAGKQPEQSGGVRVMDRGLGAAGPCRGPSVHYHRPRPHLRGSWRGWDLAIVQPSFFTNCSHTAPAARRRHTAEVARAMATAIDTVTTNNAPSTLFLAVDFIFMVGSSKKGIVVCHRPCSRNRSTIS